MHGQNHIKFASGRFKLRAKLLVHNVNKDCGDGPPQQRRVKTLVLQNVAGEVTQRIRPVRWSRQQAAINHSAAETLVILLAR